MLPDISNDIIVSRYQSFLCPHQDRYSFKKDSPLHSYLKTCKGWQKDSSNRYNVNYIIFVILAEVKTQNRLIRDFKDNFYILSDSSLKQALTVKIPVVGLGRLRKIVLKQMIHLEPLGFRHSYPFWCLPAATDSAFASLFQLENDDPGDIEILKNKLISYRHQCRT